MVRREHPEPVCTRELRWPQPYVLSSSSPSSSSASNYSIVLSPHPAPLSLSRALSLSLTHLGSPPGGKVFAFGYDADTVCEAACGTDGGGGGPMLHGHPQGYLEDSICFVDAPFTGFTVDECHRWASTFDTALNIMGTMNGCSDKNVMTSPVPEARNSHIAQDALVVSDCTLPPSILTSQYGTNTCRNRGTPGVNWEWVKLWGLNGPACKRKGRMIQMCRDLVQRPTMKMQCYDSCINFPYGRVVPGVNENGRSTNTHTDLRCGLSRSIDSTQSGMSSRCKAACSQCDAFFEENLDQFLGPGSSEEDCFEWNIEVSRIVLLRARSPPPSPVALCSCARALPPLPPPLSLYYYARGCALASFDTQFSTRPSLIFFSSLFFFSSGRAATAVRHPTRPARSYPATAAIAHPLPQTCARRETSRALTAFGSASATISWYHRA